MNFLFFSNNVRPIKKKNTKNKKTGAPETIF